MFKKLSPKVNKDERAKDKEIDKLLGAKQRRNRQMIKVLLLGSGESGKTTVFKQMCLLKGNGFTEQYFMSMKAKLCGNIVEGTHSIITAAKRLNVELPAEIADAVETVVQQHKKYFHEVKSVSSLTEDWITHADEIESVKPLNYITRDLAKAICKLWDSDSFRDAYKKAVAEGRTDFGDSYPSLMDSLAQNYPKFGGEEWMPDKRDVLLARVRTTGMADEIFDVKFANGKVKIQLIDVGGQKSERRKWLKLFRGVHSVIYVVSLSEYDQIMFEETDKYRLADSLDLFHDLAQRNQLHDSALVLFLNKFDLFRNKYVVDRVPINVSGLFPDAPKVEDEENTEECNHAIDWFKARYLEPLDDAGRSVYSHVTTALDPDNMTIILNATTLHILESNIKASGLTG